MYFFLRKYFLLSFVENNGILYIVIWFGLVRFNKLSGLAEPPNLTKPSSSAEPEFEPERFNSAGAVFDPSGIQFCRYSILQVFDSADIRFWRYSCLQVFRLEGVQFCRYSILQVFDSAGI